MYRLFLVLPLFFTVFLTPSPIPLHAQQDNPVIEAAMQVAASLSGEDGIRANAAIQRAQTRLEGDTLETLHNALAAANQITDARQRSQAFIQVARNIVLENINSYDEILKIYHGVSLLDYIIRHCSYTRQYDLGYQFIEKFFELSPDSEWNFAHQSSLNQSLWWMIAGQIRDESLEAVISSVNRLENPVLRQNVMDAITRAISERLTRLLRSDHTIEDNREALKHFLRQCYPDIDISDWSKAIVAVFEKMSKDVEQIVDPGTRFNAYTNLINAYRRINSPQSEETLQPEAVFDFFPGILPPHKPSTTFDPVLSELLLAAAETAKLVREDGGNFSRQKRLAITVRLLIENADTESANQIVDHMLAIPAQIENPSMRATAMLDVIPLLYRLDRNEEASKMCDMVLQLINSDEGGRFGLSHLLTQVIAEKANAGLFAEATQLVQMLPERRNILYDERLVHAFRGAYSRYVSWLLAEERYEEAINFIDEVPTALGDKILLLQMVGQAYRQANDIAKSDETFKKMFVLVDALVEREAERAAAGRPDNLGIRDDRSGDWGASLSRTYSHPIVQSRRERGDIAGAVDLARRLFATHEPRVQILSIARGYADAGDYASALEVGGSAASEFASDSGIRGYVAYAMFRHGKIEEAEQLLNETLREIEDGTMSLHLDFIVGLLLCGKIDEAIRLGATADSQNEEPIFFSSRHPIRFFTPLLMVGREAEAIRLVDEWQHAAGKVWGIQQIIRWNHEEHLAKGNASLLTPELKERWIDFLIGFADTLEEPNPTNRVGAWYRAAECLIDLGAEEAALRVLDKALEATREYDRTIPAHLRSGSVNVRVQVGRLFVRLGEREKGDIAFVRAIADGSLHDRDFSRAESLRHTLFQYTDTLLEENPENIRTWAGYMRSENNRHIRTLRTFGEHRLFSDIMVL